MPSKGISTAINDGSNSSAYLIVALLKLTDASLAQWAIAINQPTQRLSRFKRLQRFLMQFQFSAKLYAQVIGNIEQGSRKLGLKTLGDLFTALGGELHIKFREKL